MLFRSEGNFKIDMNRARNLRGADKKEPLTFEKAEVIIKGEPKEKKSKPPKYWNNIYTTYFKPEQKENEVKSIIERALEMYYKSLDNENVPEQEVEKEGLEM